MRKLPTAQVLVWLLLSSMIAAPVALGDQLVDAAWGAYRTHDFLRSEFLYRKILERNPYEHVVDEKDLAERIGILYAAMGLSPAQALSRLGCDDWFQQKISASMTLRQSVSSAKNVHEGKKTEPLQEVGASAQSNVVENTGNMCVAVAAQSNVSGPQRSSLQPDTYDNAPATATLKILIGAVEHSARLEPVIQSYRQGKTVNVRAIEAAISPDNNWRKVAPELAGTWEKQEETVLSSRDLKDYKSGGINVLVEGREIDVPQTNKVHSVLILGFQRDTDGLAWTYTGGVNAVVTSNLVYSVDTEIQNEILKMTARGWTEKTVRTRIVVSKRDSRVRAALQKEEISVFTLTSKDELQMESSTKSFDADGDELSISKSKATLHRKAPFRQINRYQGKDMHFLFEEFMRKSGRFHLVP